MNFNVKGSITFEQEGRKIVLCGHDFREEQLVRCFVREGRSRTEAIFIGRYSGLGSRDHEVSFRAVREGALSYVHQCLVFEAAVTNVEISLEVVIAADSDTCNG